MLITLVLAAGEAKRFVGYQRPKQFLTVGNSQMWEAAIDSLTLKNELYVVIQDRHKQYFKRAFRLATEILLPRPTVGQADTLKQGLLHVQNSRRETDDEVLVVNCDNGFAPGLLDRLVVYGRRQERPAALTFPATVEEQHRWSYVDGHPEFSTAEEKIAIGTHALAGAYYFPNRIYLQDACDEAVDWVSGTGREPYLSRVYEFLLSPKLSIECRREDMYDWGTPEALERWNEQHR